MGWECFCVVGFDLNSCLVTFLHNTLLQGTTFLSFSSVSFGISFEHAVQLPFTVLLYSTFPDNYAFLSLSPSQIKNTQSADTVPVHGHSPLVFQVCPEKGGFYPLSRNKIGFVWEKKTTLILGRLGFYSGPTKS